MKPGAPWSVKGIDPQTRETAKSAARRAGMTLGEWLNHVILDTGKEPDPSIDPMRDPGAWAEETGAPLPWAGPIDDLSASVNERLAAAEHQNADRLKNLESAIGTLAERLASDPGLGGTTDPDMTGRLDKIEAGLKERISVRHLETLETAVGQISVVLDNQARKQDEKIDGTKEALADLDRKLGETSERINQALSAVEAAAELYDITDRQGRMIDSLATDVAALQLHQSESESQAGEIRGLRDDLIGLKEQMSVAETRLVEVSQRPTLVPQEAIDQITSQITGQITGEITDQITGQITEHEAHTAQSVGQIEAQIEHLSGLIDRTLAVRDNSVENLQRAFANIVDRLNALEARSPNTHQGETLHLEETKEIGVAPQAINEPEVVAEEEAPVAAHDPAPDLAPAAPARPVLRRVDLAPAITFRALQPASNKTVRVSLAVTPMEPVAEAPVVAETSAPIPAPEVEADLEEDFVLAIDAALAADVETADALEDEPETSEASDAIVEDEVEADTEEPVTVSERADVNGLLDISAQDFAEDEDVESEDDIEELVAIEKEEPAKTFDPDEIVAELVEDEHISLADILGATEADQDAKTEGQDKPRRERTPDEDAALKEAVSNISSIRASFAGNDADQRLQGAAAFAKGHKPPRGSMRQVVDSGESEASRRGWALTASGMAVGAVVVSAMLLWPNEAENLVATNDRPGIVNQFTAWFDSVRKKPVQIELADNASEDTGSGTIGIPASTATADVTTPPFTLASFSGGLVQAAENGNAKAQFALARAYANGDTVSLNPAEAVKWYKAAADQGLAIAQYVLGSLSERGIDMAQDRKAAIDWYAAAARGGNRRSMHNLAVAYARGESIPQDLTKAAYWFTEAANLGLSDAQYNLALLYERGLGVTASQTAAYKWYGIAAMSGDAAAAKQAERLAADLTEDERDAVNREIDQWQSQQMDPIANGLFDISPAAYNNLERRTSVANVQKRLADLGYAVRAQDGIMDPSTQAAIRAYEASQNLDVTGRVTPDLVKVLYGPGQP